MKCSTTALLAWLALWALPATLDATEPCNLRVGWEPYAPYTFAEESGRVTGFDIDLIRAIGEEIGCTIELTELPWARILREIENGTLDVSTSTSRTPERTHWALFSEPYRQTQMAIYVRRGEINRYSLNSLADLPREQFRLGVIVDYYYGKTLADLLDDPDYAKWVDGGTDYQTNIRKLIIGRINGYLAEDVNVMEAELRRLGLADRVERYPLQVPGERLHFMFSRRTVDPKHVASVNDAIARMRTDGRLEAILSKHLH